jgi:type I restriction enzyme S subunit
MTLPDQRISSEVPDRSIQKPRSSCKRELIRRSLKDSSYPFPVYSNTVANEGLYGFYSIPEYEGDSVTGVGLGTAFARTGGYGAIGRLLVLMPNHRVDARFLTTYINQRVSIFIETGGIPQLTGIQFSKYKTALPPLPEQRAIAKALSDVDELLGGLDRLITKKRDLKQAAMQQLLTGQTRLPGFHGEWDVKRLGDVIHLIRGGIYGEEKPRHGLRPSSVATTAHIEQDDTWNDKEMPVRYFTEENLRDYATVEGDLIVVKSSGSAASIQSGKLGFIDTERAGKFVFSNFLMLLRPTAVLPRFLYFYLCSHNVKKLLPTLVEASTYPNIRLGDYLAVEIPVPPLPEQTAIASVLTDMDAELAGLEQRREKTRALKQAMMQELLTGRIRLV